jgi:hypothetical protein
MTEQICRNRYSVIGKEASPVLERGSNYNNSVKLSGLKNNVHQS